MISWGTLHLFLSHPSLILALAATLDFLIGDPWEWLHPVQVMGWSISQFANWILAQWQQPWQRRFAGVFLGLVLMGGSGTISWLLIAGMYRIHPGLGIGVETILLASCFAGRSLRKAAEEVLIILQDGNLEQARSRLSLYVGRDTEQLSESEVLRAILETVAENTTDGVMAPLFYAIAGTLIPGVGAVPLTFAYKAASTLDSMVGYRREPYTDLGWFSARFEDYLTWIPCRLTVLTLGLLAAKPKAVWQLCRRDGTQDPSPNSGWSECAYAGALGVQLGGRNFYQGILREKPLLGDPLNPITASKIAQGLRLTRWSFLLWLSLSIALIQGIH